MKLLVDIGNTRLKWAIADNGALKTGVAMDYRLPEFADRLTQSWAKIERPQQLAIASVAAPAMFDCVSQTFNRLWPDLPIFVAQSSVHALGVRNAYSQPERLGVDRWLALLAAHRHYPGNVCVVDCGTAITVDVLGSDGRHMGGLISPGLTTMRNSLVSEAAALEFNHSIASLELAANTQAAIANGTLMAATGLISTTLQGLSDEYRLVITGGDAKQLAAAFPLAMVDECLVFKGLAALADEGCPE
jgi:type III pantothenate kinase